MEGFSSGENVRLVLRLKETARCACAACWQKHAVNRIAKRQARKSGLLTPHRAEYSTDIPRESLRSPAQAASAHPDDVTGPSWQPAASHPSLFRSAQYRIRPRIDHRQRQPLNDTASSAPVAEKKAGHPSAQCVCLG